MHLTLGGQLKTIPDKESLSAGWHKINKLRKRSSEMLIQLRCRDFLQIIDEALKYRNWHSTNVSSFFASIMEEPLTNIKRFEQLKFAPILNKNEAQPGLFIEFVIVKKNLSM